jgi:hypothetical protein
VTPRRRNLAALAFLLALVSGFYWKLTLPSGYTWFESPDTALQVHPWLDYQAREVHAGRLPLWDPNLWAGQSLIGQVQPGTANPLNWILFALPLRDGHIPIPTLHWYWVLIHWLAAAFCYWLCRDLKAGVLPSLLGASIFALTGFMGHTEWPQMLMSAVPIPLILMFFARMVRGERPLSSAALCGAALGAAFLAGHHNIPIYTAVLMSALWLWFLASRRRDRKAWTSAAVFLVVFPLVSAFQALPAIEYGRHAMRWVGTSEPLKWNDKVPYEVHARFSLPPGSVPGVAVPGMASGLQANPYVGFVAISLALTGVVLGWRSREVRLFAVVSLAGLLLALGGHTPVHRLAYEWIPMVEKARYPIMAIVLCQLGIAVLAALGLEALPSRRIAAPAFLFLFLVEAVLAAPPFTRFDRPGSFAQQMADQSDIAAFLMRQPGWFRVEADEDAVPYNFGDWFGIEQFGGYTASIPENVSRLNGSENAPRLLGIQYRIAHRPANPFQVEVFRSRSGLIVYRDPRIGEPVWSIHTSRCEGADQLKVAGRSTDTLSIEADLRCAGLVASGAPTFPGWRAWVDGRRVPIQEVEGALRAVAVDSGRHRVEFRYRPGSVYWGAALTVLGLLLAAHFCARERRSNV